ncbi:glycoside hydrolase [Microthyrium microscopicum]|uniref:lytic cellulose monooxygenase (C4-dehydrogenating) n=1 Tax=Microthyrium microscopicum TaxID=703497 RepID=A0A6A6UFV2_9PEZI|nr:glycoside hydrolase [Microthyrium microscopicum]
MVGFSSVIVPLYALLSGVAAHGSLKAVEVNGKKYMAWQINADPYEKGPLVRYARRVLNEGPVKDFTGKGITCGDAGNQAAAGIIPVNAGDKVKLIWDQWGSSHSGPVMDYMAKCTGSDNCASFKGDSGPVWVKIDQAGYDTKLNPPWASDRLGRQNATWTTTIPKSLAPGDYLLRHEILGLHVAGKRMGAQFYPTCVQIKLTSSGTANPKGIALPGAYQPDDKGILVELWRVNQGQVQYTPPGGPVWNGV